MPGADERRRYIRLATPINISYIVNGKDKMSRAVSKDVSALGVRFETKENIDVGTKMEIILELPGTLNPVHAQGRLIWSKRVSLEDNSPYDVGIEFTKVEEDNKNTFLKYLCDLIYKQAQK